MCFEHVVAATAEIRADPCRSQPKFGLCSSTTITSTKSSIAIKTSNTTTTSSSIPTPTKAPISTDGRCGPDGNGATCQGSKFGPCCSVRGNCGSSVDYCAITHLCQPQFGTCKVVSEDGKCGSASTVNATCLGSTFGDCCSVKGNCGTGPAFCADINLCQPTFGTCTVTPKDGKCGSASTTDASCPGSTFGDCCSPAGNCGKTLSHCAAAWQCQPAYGTYKATSTDGKCGSASSVTAICIGSTSGDCCSVKGNCGKTDAFFSSKNLCQAEFGTCTA